MQIVFNEFQGDFLKEFKNKVKLIKKVKDFLRNFIKIKFKKFNLFLRNSIKLNIFFSKKI